MHGEAGDLAAAELGQDGMIAGDLVRRIPAAPEAPAGPFGDPNRDCITHGNDDDFLAERE